MAHSLVVSNLQLLTRSDERPTPSASSGPRDDAFGSLAPGEQRIARALYDAQRAGGASGSSRSEPGSRRRSLDEIAGMERSGARWSQVFKQLKAEGLIAEQTLGHVVARWTGCAGRADAGRSLSEKRPG